MKTLHQAGVCVAAALAVACGSDSGSTGADPNGGGGAGGAGAASATGGSPTAGGSGGAGGGSSTAPNEGAELKWRIREADANVMAPPVPVEGARICVLDRDEIPCVESDADGFFTFPALPRDAELALTLEKDGFYPYIRPIETSNIDMDRTQSAIHLRPVDSGIEDALGIELDPEKGRIDFTISARFGIQALGSTADLTPAAGEGPFFYDDGLGWDATRTGTVSWGGAFFNVPEGTYQVTFSSSFENCAPISFPFGTGGWHVGEGPTVGVPVRPGFLTEGIVVCDPMDPAAPASPDAGGD
jgi:hypothetical protein